MQSKLPKQSFEDYICNEITMVTHVTASRSPYVERFSNHHHPILYKLINDSSFLEDYNPNVKDLYGKNSNIKFKPIVYCYLKCVHKISCLTYDAVWTDNKID